MIDLPKVVTRQLDVAREVTVPFVIWSANSDDPTPEGY